MKAKCIKDLTIDGYRFEEGREYDFEWHLFTHDADERDSVLARGCKVMYTQYAVKYKFNLILPKMYGEMKFDEVPAMLYLYDRQYCEHEDYTAPPIYPRGWTSGGPLLCFDDFFEEVHDDATIKTLFSPDIIGDMKFLYPTWRGQMLGGTRLSDWPSQDKTKEK